MNENNLVAEEIERLGVHTFSVAEMALNLLGLMHPDLVRLAEAGPVYADLNGGMSGLKDLHLVTRSIRAGLQSKSDLLLAKHREALEEAKQLRSAKAAGAPAAEKVRRRANFDFGFQAKSDLSLRGHPGLSELLDLRQVVVAVGFGEVGPWGNARTRWEMEAQGCFSLEGCIQLAWLMGLVRYEGDGWVDAASGEPVPDSQVKARYEERILAHSGIRVIEPEVLNGYDPHRKWMTQEVALNEDMRPVEVSAGEAEQFKLEHGDRVVVSPVEGSDRCLVRMLKGAVLYIPKALRFDRFVAGLVPTGWSAERYGIPKDIIDQVDPITLFVLVSTVEALVAAGITDPYEFYQYVHLSELGNVSGGGVGGQRSNQRIFRSRFLDRPVQSDILQESFINTMPAWVNLLLLSSAGPIKTPVGACATAVESIDIGVETILAGKARVVLAGGYDDFREEGSFEFAAMQATSSAAEEAAKGREPGEMSRPMASSRAGFMESQGAGIQVLMSAQLAIEMGCPIYGVIAAVNTATDKEGRSVPAPGQGILTTARSIRASSVPRALDLEYRLGQLGRAKAAIQAWYEEELEEARLEAAQFVAGADGEAFLSARTNDLRLEAARRLAAEQRQWGQDFAHGDPRIAPLAQALARFGLSVDDIALASFHGTGTKANDTNESAVLQQQLEQLGRAKGNVCLAICQKYLTGHPKGAAAAWMLNGYADYFCVCSPNPHPHLRHS
jgi:3-oxoacyl-(acyl-carrier-protein) synthase